MDAPAPAGTLFGLTATDVGTLLAALATLAMLFALYAVMTVRDPMAKRVKALNERREQLKAGITASTGKRRASLVKKNQTTDNMRSFLSSLKVLQDDQLKDAQIRLAQAGIRSKDLAVAVIFGRMFMPIIIGGLAVVLLYVVGIQPEWGPMKRFFAFAITLILAYKAPDLYIDNKVTKRSAAIRKGLPDALDLLVICAEAGLTVDAAFNRVARELGKAYPELGDEFQLTAIELSFLTERRMAFENLANRVKLDAVKGVVTTMVQTEKYGTPLASALRVLSAEFRHERMMRAEEKAARLPAIMTVPLILFILPTLFVVILGPAACSNSEAFSKNRESVRPDAVAFPANAPASAVKGGGGCRASRLSLVSRQERGSHEEHRIRHRYVGRRHDPARPGRPAGDRPLDHRRWQGHRPHRPLRQKPVRQDRENPQAHAWPPTDRRGK